MNNVFAVYRSDVDGSIPFSTVQSSGLVDSSLLQGLNFIASNGAYCGGLSNEVNFFQPPCDFKPTRYYVLVEIRSQINSGQLMYPNHQVEVSVLLDSTSSIPPKFDHFSQANDMGIVNSGIKKGATDNFTCATKDLPDPLYAYTTCQKTLWYKFTTTTTGQIRYAAFFNNTNNWYYDHIQLFRQVKPNDSSATGLIHMPYSTNYSNNGYWAQQCISPGTYYIILPGCNAVNEDVYPQIEIIPQAGDFCSAPAIANVNGPGAVSATLIPDCHTIGTDYGEFATTLTCPAGAATTEYKTSWFRMDIGGTDTLDVTAYLVENTNASSTQIKYRLMTGDCGAMQEQSCVQDALTQNTYQCLLPGQKYYVQVFTPVKVSGYDVTGTLDLKLSAIKHADTCSPVNTCLASANFIAAFDCTKDEAVKFNNFSTYGTAITYKWTFDYGGQSSTALSPSFIYPADTVTKIYNVKMVASNTSCGKKDSVTIPVSIPARPVVDFGADLVQCNGNPVTLNATSFTGATYLWQNGTANPTFIASTTGQNQYTVKVTYSNCISTDTINILINPVTKKALQSLVVCNGDSALLNASRGFGETYTWSTGVSTASIYAKIQGTYWVDIKYSTCTIRDTFIINTVSTARPLGNDTLVCLAKAAYTATATVTGAISYAWQNGTTNPVFSITTPGLFWVDINFGGCTVRDTLNVTGYPAAIVSNAGAATCAGTAYLLPWGQSVNASGTYRDTTRYSSGCDSLIRNITVTVNPKPSLGIDKSIAVCFGNAANLTTQYTTTGLTANWTLSGSAIANPASVNVAGIYQLIVSNSFGCLDTALVTLTISPKPILGIDKAGNICAGNTFNLTSQYTTTGLTSNWTLATVAVSNPAAVAASGAYQLIASNASGCLDTAVYTLTVNAKPALGIDKSIAVCFCNSADLTSQFVTTGLTSNWTLNGTAVASLAAVNAAGIYQLIAINSNGCSDTALVTLTINPKPTLGADKAAAICAGNSFDLGTQFTTTGLTANWSLNAVAVSNPSSVTTAGVYQLIVTNGSSCKDTATVTLTVNPKPAIGIDKAISICPGFFADLTTAFSTTGLSASWTFGGIAVSNPAAVSATGIYQLIVANSFGCLDTALVTLAINPKPSLGIDKSISICAGAIVDLIAQFVTNGFTADWTNNGAVFANPSAITLAGIYQLIATSSAGCKDTSIVTITISPKPTLGADKSLTICSGKTVDLTTQFTTAGFSSSWTNVGVAVSMPTAVSQTGIYHLMLTNGNGCKDTALFNLTVNPSPVVGADKNASFCTGSSIDLTVQFTTTGLNSNWTLNGNAVASPAVITAAGIYQLIVSNNFACADTALIDVKINLLPVVTVSDPAPVCTPSTVNLTAATITAGSTTGLSYSYFLDAAASVVYPSATAASNGLYYIKGTDINGCTDMAAVNVMVYILPIASAGKDTIICYQDSALLHGNVTVSSIATLSYLWSPAAGLSNASSPTTVAKPGTTTLFTLTAIADYGACSLTVTDNILVTMQPPVPAFAGNDTNAVLGLPHQLSATGGVSYLWTPSAGLNNPFAQNPLANISRDTRFLVQVTDIAGCKDTASVKLRVYQGIRYYVPNAFSPNGDGINEIFRPLAVGVISTDWFRVYNRYGQVMYESSNIQKGWDGNVIEMKGNVVLVR
jgi:gliding motility-associated-like protein